MTDLKIKNKAVLKIKHETLPHKTKLGGRSSMTSMQKNIKYLAVDTQLGCAPGQFLCGDRYSQFM